MQTVARFLNASIPPGILLYAMVGTKPGRPDHMWNSFASMLIVWLLYRLYKAFDYEREYNFWTLKILTALFVFGLVERCLTLFGR